MRIVKDFESELESLKKSVVADDGQWAMKGFIDVFKNVYTITADTKVVSKVLEIALFPNLLEIATRLNYEIQLTPHQNYYPDITFRDKTNGDLYAIDLKTTYRKNTTNVNGMTLGAFTGYFRNRTSTKNVRHPYGQYKAHFILGVIYTRTDLELALKHLVTKNVKLTNKVCEIITDYLSEPTDENWDVLYATIPEVVREELDECVKSELKKYTLDNFKDIDSVATNFQFFFIEKWKVATDRPGSGNTKNIGSVSSIDDLLSGKGPFVKFQNGKDVFDDYWMHYETLDMAKAAGRDKPLYKNLTEYEQWKKRTT